MYSKQLLRQIACRATAVWRDERSLWLLIVDKSLLRVVFARCGRFRGFCLGRSLFLGRREHLGIDLEIMLCRWEISEGARREVLEHIYRCHRLGVCGKDNGWILDGRLCLESRSLLAKEMIGSGRKVEAEQASWNRFEES
jgi:hypothetical protein